MIARKQRVFVVDDEPVIAMTVTAILKRQGYDVEEFTDPWRALEAFQNKCPDLLVSDAMMPGLTGVDLAIQVKALCQACRIVLISGNAATVDLLYPALVAGHNFEVHSKPIAPQRLIQVVHEALHSAA